MSKFKKLLIEEKIKDWVVNNYQCLTETKFSRVMTAYFEKGFIIVSAERSCEAEKGSSCTSQEIEIQIVNNNKNDKQIRQDIRKDGFGFVPTNGGYREKVIGKDGTETYVDNPHPEKSYIIQNTFEDTRRIEQLGKDLCTKYNQDSFLFKPPQAQDPKAYFVDRNGNILATFTGKTISDLTQQYYTYLRKENPIKRFSLKEWVLYVPKPPKTATAAYERFGEIFINFSDD
jgi:hypothetical protein